MNYTIYLNKKAIILTNELHNTELVYLFDNISLDEIIHRLHHGSQNKIFLYSPNINQAWKQFQAYFDVIEAAGGLVSNSENKFLFIYRNGKWDLPKGKMEEGEKPEETAIREVKEECGIKNIEIDKFMFDTYHLFTENHKKRLKITHWYKMVEGEKSSLSPQLEEGIEKVEWIDINNNPEILDNSYENIKLILFDNY